ncbi:MAG: SDR family oxidoreductase [Myxococcales bacterium]|nr:SDR family oxidoreductase [Myxococcales bacterium]
MEQRDEARKVALVTGGAVRVGRAIVEALAASEYDVWIHYRASQGPARELCDALGDRCLGIVGAELSEGSARDALIARVCDRAGPAGGRVDLLVNSAASFERGRFTRRSDDDLRRVLEVNLVAPVALVRGLAGALARARGSVVNILDLAGFDPWPQFHDHCVAKAGLWMATRALAVELAPAIRVNGVAPGTVLWPDEARYAEGTELRARIVDAIPLARIGTPEDVARAVLFFAESPFVSGQMVAIDGGRMAGGASGY